MTFYAIILAGLVHAPISDDSFSPALVFKSKQNCEMELADMPKNLKQQFQCFKIEVK